MPGQITYQTVVCPTCGATLRAGYQAMAPEYLIADARCPFCGTVVAHDVVSLEAVSGPYYPMQSDWTGMFSAMMPMLMFVMMFAVITPMLKGVIAQ